VTVLVLLFLAGLWAAVLTPEIIRKRADYRPADSIGSFRRHMHVLQRATPIGRRSASPSLDGRVVPLRHPIALAPPAIRTGAARQFGPTSAQRRRRDILCALLAAMGGSLLLGFVPGFGVLWGFHIVLDVLFVAYGFLLTQRHVLFGARQATPRPAANVRYLEAPARAVAEPMLLRRTGN
jgi:hypothetical protein